MSKLVKITRNECDPIRKALNEAIAPVLEQFGIEGRFGNCSFDDQSLSFSKLDFNLVGGLTRKEVTELENLKFWLDINLQNETISERNHQQSAQAILDTVYTIDKNGAKDISVKFTGMSGRNGKTPFRFMDVDTKETYACSEGVVKSTIKKHGMKEYSAA